VRRCRAESGSAARPETRAQRAARFIINDQQRPVASAVPLRDVRARVPPMKLPLLYRLRTRLRATPLREPLIAYRFRGVTNNDVIFASYPKSGSTWLTFMLSELIWGEGDKQEITDSRYMPTIGKQHMGQKRLPSGGRVLRTHEQPRKCCHRAIYMARDGRDVAVSVYFHIKRITGMDAEFSEFLDDYLKGRFVGAGVWHDHVNNWLDAPCFTGGNGLLIRYEDMKEDVHRELRRCAEFLELEPTPERYEQAASVGSFESMRKTEQRTDLIIHREKGPEISFVRKGIVGDWQNHFSAADLERFDAVAGPAMERLNYNAMAPVGVL
jgi:hypothetical protein